MTIDGKPRPRATNSSPITSAQPHPIPSYISNNQIVANIATHKVSSDRAERMHLGAMKKEYMDRILTWSESRCSLSIPFHYICLAMLGYQSSLPGEFLSKNSRLTVTRHLQHLACGATAFTLWTRNYELVKLRRGDVYLEKTVVDRVFMKYLQGEEHSLTINDLNTYFEIHLKNRKGWQRKLDKGMREADLRCTNGVVQPGEPLSHDVVQAWINEAVTGAGIPRSFSTHCYHRGGAQYQFMFALRDTLMRYLLDEPHSYENDHSDALRPVSHEANGSFAGEAALAHPASTKALYTTHASLTVDVAALHMTVKEVSSTMATEMKEVKEVSSTTSAEHRANACRISPPAFIGDPAHSSHLAAPTSSCQPQRAIVIGTHKSNLPLGLLIPNVPVLHADGARTPKSDSWRDIVRHWTEGEPRLGLHTPLKDWPHHYYNGRYGRAFNMKHYQQRVVATEFLDEFQGDEVAFLKAYGGAAREGHTKLLKAILAACRQHHRDGERCSHFASMQPNSST
ncbi:hypothetical protein EDD15DRAFT_2200347 [Pisolithus albus]|nr:hypothetical protein EDD15DRAFT_2200347 [Pisolithus albus]